MPGVNGIAVGLRLREMGAAGEIIYLSASRDFAVESYQAQAFFYLLKPVASDRLFPVLDLSLIHILQITSKERRFFCSVSSQNSSRISDGIRKKRSSLFHIEFPLFCASRQGNAAAHISWQSPHATPIAIKHMG